MHNRIRLILLDSISETIFYFIVHNDTMCRGVAQKATPTQKKGFFCEWVWFVGVVWFGFQSILSSLETCPGLIPVSVSQRQLSRKHRNPLTKSLTSVKLNSSKREKEEEEKNQEHVSIIIINVSVIMDILHFLLFWRIYKLTTSLFLVQFLKKRAKCLKERVSIISLALGGPQTHSGVSQILPRLLLHLKETKRRRRRQLEKHNRPQN